MFGRGITLPDGYLVGYAPVGGGLIAHLRSLGFDEDQQIAAGAARVTADGQIRDVFRDRIVVPIADGTNIAGFAGRALRDDTEPKHLNTAAVGLFDKSRLLYGLTEGAQRLHQE